MKKHGDRKQASAQMVGGRRKMLSGVPDPADFIAGCQWIKAKSHKTMIQSMSFTSFSSNALTCRKVKGNRFMFPLRQGREPQLQALCIMHGYSD